MDGNLEISLDKLPVRRLESIEENGAERYPADVGYEENRVSLIRRIDFAWALEDEEEKERKRKQKKKSSKDASTEWQWKSMVENLQLARQELSVILDLIGTVEANDAITLAGMNGVIGTIKTPDQEKLSYQSVSAATKLQCYQHLGKYFKQSAKAFEQQISKEARFYGALIRLQQNWKVKRQRLATTTPGSEGFTIDLFDSSLYNSMPISRASSLSTIRIEHDSGGMLAINLPPSSCRSLHFGFVGKHSADGPKRSSYVKAGSSVEYPSGDMRRESHTDDDCVRETHLLLREVHQAIFDEQVFDVVNREAFSQSLGVNVTGMRENYLQLSIGQGTSLFISLVPSSKNDAIVDNADIKDFESSNMDVDTFDDVKLGEREQNNPKRKWSFPNRTSCEIYLEQVIHEHVFVKGKDKLNSTGNRASGPVKDGSGLLAHFCMSLAHRIFSKRVLMELENVVCGVPYLQLMTHPTWHSRTSSWTLFVKFPQSILNAGFQPQTSDIHSSKNGIKSQFRTKVVVNDDRIIIQGEGAPNVAGLFKKSSEETCSMNKYDCDLADLPLIILQQVASQVIRWLHEEALMVGIKASHDFLSLTFELEQGESVSLVAHVDPDDIQGCVSWWLVMENGFAEEPKLNMDLYDGRSNYRKFLGHLSLDTLYATLMDLVSLCGGAVNH